ncbi:MAG: response regulator transcription factor [Fusobacterium sp.]
MKILIIEDDLEIQNLIYYFFKKENFQVDKTANGLDGLKLLKDNHYDAIILDLMIPGIDGTNFTKIIKTLPEDYGHPKIIMVTAKTDIDDVLTGLEIGADDYLKKPFDPRELVLRTKKLLKSTNTNLDDNIIFKDIIIKSKEHIVISDENEIELSKKEYDLLSFLIQNKNLVITREKILDNIWKSNYYPGDRTVDVYISKLRDKLPTFSKYIKTIKGVGYKLEEKK